MTTNAPYFNHGSDIAILSGDYTDVFSLLGMHKAENGKSLLVRCFIKGAIAVEVMSLKDGKKVAELAQIDDQGLFAGVMGRRVKPFLYSLKVTYPMSVETIIDPYQFSSLINPDDVYLFAEGKQQKSYQFLGANWRQTQGVEGVHFCVWAPNAKRVSLVGDVNHWDGRQHVMRFHPSNGIWEIFLPHASAGQFYKYQITNQYGEQVEKADPYAVQMQSAPGNSSVIPAKSDYQWNDNRWLTQRGDTQLHHAPMSTYEVQLASWKRKGEWGDEYLNYQDLIDQLIPYIEQMGFTHLQLMPISEYPFDGSWGYQPVGLYAATYRFGDPVGLKAFIDACHARDIGVLLDWVPAHFPKDPHGLSKFDGSCLYEHEDPRQGEHPDWDTLIYNYGRGEVQSFLLSNACYWLEEFHFDGLRLDAVSSMLYLDYSRDSGQWLPNEYGGRENIQAIEFLKLLNERIYASYPGVAMIAEESTAWPGVTNSTENGGLGFGFKWNMGWMNDSLSYLKRDPIYRSHHHHELTFALVYAYTEQFILSVSHDEVVHGKGSLLHKIPGDDWQKFATLRAYFGLMWGQPGKKLIFMGSEFAQRDEWNHNQSLDWHLLQYAPHQGMQDWVRDLNNLYLQYPCMYELDHQTTGFQWLDCDNSQHSVFSFVRYAKSTDEHLVFIINMTPQVHHHFRVGLPLEQDYVEVLNSDSHCYGGSDVTNSVIAYDKEAWQGMKGSGVITVPPLACVVLAVNSNNVLDED
ncbi:1,4-alpha-glucan branching protein GlgB [Shewanella sp. 1_MG-2023]|uniref:1,4-alpha-glucan branching protein GlgB n=1 Tax=unclassified Shewanella TaxID=196818 RepID=UPI0026E36A5D|nr:MULTISPECIES: 1,4-alpha-glucan branching protein GlgB [unclassified Shewanella]MDO6612406.1 1,4-alpha-glucan branching protein GlgB [Shewanella sp. 7_MG-2023]MDO6772260.1 1,4-alpha-glucan branching protein GlgB [Shewanella sp. 2_MG-2023]MDO6794166.1 1,4-alpha-glucan branching protein GlgB [Shewanella sp. 1_MG-2023]